MTAVNDAVTAASRRSSGKRSFLDTFFSSVKGPSFNVTFWDGSFALYGKGRSEFNLAFRQEPDLQELFVSPSLFFGEGVMRGEIEIEGSHTAMARALEAVSPPCGDMAGRFMSLALSGLSCAPRSLARQKSDIAAHYDLGSDFFSLWLDEPTTSYSCAYFNEDADSLDTAQLRKIDLVLKKLRIRPGMRVLDIGCGWGGLSMRAAAEYGAEVLAVTLSEEEASAVRRRFAERGLEDRCEVRLCNYCELKGEAPFDRVMSMGMFEHVGKAHHKEFFDTVATLLRPGGVCLLHTLTKSEPGETDPWIAKYIFPGGRIPALAEVVANLPESGFMLLHAESLRRHYVRTLDMWHENFNRPKALDYVRTRFGPEFERMWSLYLRMASAFLAIGVLDVQQFVFSRGPADDLPMTLEDIYGPAHA